MKLKKRTPRYRWLFYNRNDIPDKYGEVDGLVIPRMSGIFAIEKAIKPVEIVDDTVSISEIQYVLIGAYVKRYWDVVQSGMFAWCPATDRTMELVGDPIDPDGNAMDVMIYLVDNIRRPINTGRLGREFDQYG